MRSIRFASPGSPSRKRVPANWPIDIALPLLLGLLMASVIAPFTEMFLGPHFGLSAGHSAPWAWALALMFSGGYWITALIDRVQIGQVARAAALITTGIAACFLWFGLDPAYPVVPLLRHPIGLVREYAFLIPPFALSLGVWIQGIRARIDSNDTSPESIRLTIRTSWAALIVAMVISGLIKGDMGHAGMRQSMFSLPVALASSAGATALAEFRRTRDLTVQRGGQAPGWDRWLRIFGGTVVLVLLVTFVGLVIVGPGTLQAVVDTVSTIFRGFGMALLYIVYGLVYAVIYLIRGVSWLLGQLGIHFKPIEPPEMPNQPAPQGTPEVPQQGEPAGEMPYLTLLRWIGIAFGLIVAVIVVVMIARSTFRQSSEGEFEEERSSLFSGDLLRNQLRDMFRRRHRPAPPRRLDLAAAPGSVRDTMLYVQVLARRHGLGRSPEETPADFSDRLSHQWPESAEPLMTLRTLYEATRYGETEQDRQQALSAWNAIRANRPEIAGRESS